MSNIDWIFFDVGGVLLNDADYENARLDALHRAIRIFDSRVSRQQVLNAMPRASAMVGNLNDNILGLFINESQKLQMARSLMAGRREIMYANRGTVRPDAYKVLEKLSAKFKIGLIANQPTKIRTILEESGITDFLDYLKVSEDHGLAKPDVRYFKAVLNEAGTIPERSLIVDDNIERGLLPAKRIGMTTVWFKNVERNDIAHDQIDHIVKSLSDMLEINEKIS